MIPSRPQAGTISGRSRVSSASLLTLLSRMADTVVLPSLIYPKIPSIKKWVGTERQRSRHRITNGQAPVFKGQVFWNVKTLVLISKEGTFDFKRPVFFSAYYIASVKAIGVICMYYLSMFIMYLKDESKRLKISRGRFGLGWMFHLLTDLNHKNAFRHWNV